MAFHTTRWTLIDAAKQGDEAALETLLERYRAPVVGYLTRSGLSAADAEDVAQEVFLRLYQKVLPTAEATRGRFRGLLLTVTKNVAIEHARRRKALRRGGEHAHVPLEDGLTGTLEPDPVFDREWLGHLLTRGLERLEQEHPNYHAALSGTLLDERSYAEVAEELGTTVTNVRNHLYRGKQKLVGYLHDEVDLYSATPQEHETEITLLNGLLARG